MADKIMRWPQFQTLWAKTKSYTAAHVSNEATRAQAAEKALSESMSTFADGLEKETIRAYEAELTKANASEVYTKNDVDVKLATKATTTALEAETTRATEVEEGLQTAIDDVYTKTESDDRFINVDEIGYITMEMIGAIEL